MPQERQQQQQQQLIHVDRPEMPETFADSVHSLVFDGQTFRIDLAVTRIEQSGAKPGAAKGRRYTACRLVLPPKAALELTQKLNGMLKAMQKQGVLKAADPKTAESPAR